ncbi:MAG: hypothetical protein IT261_06485 [Saprospiraceae bacterium]|nr:hypothetical protein [Saprospiraceae bacterium]
MADLDQDGDPDLVTGNLGLNTRFQASENAPLGCYASDFDNNGTIDPIMTMYEGDKNYPLAQKENITKQLPGLKKKFLYAKDWSEATIEDVWDKMELENALHLTAYHLETCWWENQGGKFVKRMLPNQTQSAVIQGIIAEDMNQDGIIDMLLAGNKYDLEVEGGRCDAGNGVFLSGAGKGQFVWVDNTQSGFWANREARDLISLRTKSGKPIIIVSNNNSAAQVFQ